MSQNIDETYKKHCECTVTQNFNLFIINKKNKPFDNALDLPVQ
jgi:hypothetical protein